MTTAFSEYSDPNVSSSESSDRAILLARLPELARKIRIGAEQRDLERLLPFEALELYRQSGLSALRVPRALGGPGGSIEDYIESIAVLAAADSNVAHVLRLHFNYVEQQILSAPEYRDEQAIERLLAGKIFGGAHTEQITQRPGEVTVKLIREGDHFRLNGRKWYATGTAYSDFANFSAVNDEGRNVSVLLPVEREGITILDDWDGMGQRLTASGGVLLENVIVYPDEVRQRVTDDVIGRHTSTLRQLHLAACAAGIVRSILADGIDYVRHHARTTAHSPAATSRDDHFVQQIIGDIAARSLAIDALIRESAQALDRTVAAISRHNDDEIEEALVQSSLTTSRTQLNIAILGLPAAEKLFEIGGGSATSSKYNFDRHWRNLRTVLNHNPLLHKARVVGDYYINGTTTHLKEGKVF